MGELNTGIWVADGADWDPTAFSLGGVTMPNAEAAAGWGGDRLVTLPAMPERGVAPTHWSYP